VVKKRTLKKSQQLVDEFVDEGIPLTEPGFGDLEADTQRAIKESLKDAHGAPRGPLPPVVFREINTGKFQLLPEVEGKGKEKVGAEQAAQVLLNLQTPKKKSQAEQYIFQRRTSAPTETSGHDESSSLYVELGLSNSDTESDEEVPPVVKSGTQEEGQAGPNPGKQDEGQAGPNPVVVVVILTTTILTTIPLTPQPQQGSLDSILINRLGELEQHIADLVDANQALEERLDKHGSRLYRKRFRDLPKADMKEILHNRMWESKSYQTHEDHMMLYEALEKSMARDNSDQLLSDLAEARKKKKKRQGKPNTPPGSPPPPPPLVGPFGTSGASGAFELSQSPPPPPSPSNNQGELHMGDDTTADEQAYLSSGEDVRRDHIPTVNLRQTWWKPLTEDRYATPEPAWSIPSSALTVPMNN
ncbi:hypothetical protein Tco_0917816, partial [Tanacetum coccineum]